MSGEQHQEHDGPSDSRRGRGGNDLLRPGDSRSNPPAHDEPGYARSRMRSRLRSQ